MIETAWCHAHDQHRLRPIVDVGIVEPGVRLGSFIAAVKLDCGCHVKIITTRLDKIDRQCQVASRLRA